MRIIGLLIITRPPYKNKWKAAAAGVGGARALSGGEINDSQRAAWQKSSEVFDVALLPTRLKLTLPSQPSPRISAPKSN